MAEKSYTKVMKERLVYCHIYAVVLRQFLADRRAYAIQCCVCRRLSVRNVLWLNGAF